MLGHARRDVGVVVLDRKDLGGWPIRSMLWVIYVPLRIARRQVVGMHIMGDDFWLYTKQPLEVLDHGLVRDQGLVVLHVANVLAHEGVVFPGHAEGILKLSATAQDLLHPKRKVHWIRCVATRTADGEFVVLEDPNHRIVATGVDVAVMEEESICQR